MLKDITFGQYYESRSLIHRTDPRLKTVLLIALIVFIFLAKNALSMGLSVLFVLSVMAVSKVPVKLYLKNMKAILPVLIFTGIINLFYGEGETLVSFWKLEITTGGIYRAVFMMVRITLLGADLHHNAQ